MLFQPHIFWWYSIISESVNYVALLYIIVTYIKENIITKLQKLHSPPRNLRAGNKSPEIYWEKPLSDLSPTRKTFIVRSESTCITFVKIVLAIFKHFKNVYIFKTIPINFNINGQNTRSDFTCMILHICKISVYFKKSHEFCSL